MRSRWVVGACLGLALAGCGSSAEVLQAGDGVRVLIAASADGGSDARMTGTLAVLEGGGLGIDADGTPFLMAWPGAEASVDDGEVSLEFDGREYQVGDEVSFNGGSADRDSGRLPEVPAECVGDEVFVVND